MDFQSRHRYSRERATSSCRKVLLILSSIKNHSFLANLIFAEIKTGNFSIFCKKWNCSCCCCWIFFAGYFFRGNFFRGIFEKKSRGKLKKTLNCFFRGILKKIRGKLRKTLQFFSRDFWKKIRGKFEKTLQFSRIHHFPLNKNDWKPMHIAKPFFLKKGFCAHISQ